MQSISESLFMRVLCWLIPPFICAGQYFVTGTFALALVLLGFPWVWIIFALPVIIVGLLMLPFWYKTFCDPTFVGPDRPVRVQWSNARICFSGAYFDIEVPVSNILGYRVVGFRKWSSTFTLNVKVRKTDGSVASMWLSTAMPMKTELLSFLEKQLTDPSSSEKRGNG